jgi:hypothetical protein
MYSRFPAIPDFASKYPLSVLKSSGNSQEENGMGAPS